MRPLVRLAGLGLIATCFQGTWALAALGGLSLLRVPRRRLALELAVLGAIGLFLGGRIEIGVLVLSLLALALGEPVLPLNGMDRYFIAQTYPGLPLNSHHVVDTREPLDRAALERALDALMRDVPLARSFVREAFLGVERFAARRPWKRASELVSVATRSLEEDPSPLERPFDLSREPPVRLLIADGGRRTVLTAHHSAVDGEGGLILLDLFLRRYESETAPPALPPFRRLRGVLLERGLGWCWAMARRHVRPFAKVGAKHATLHDDLAPVPYVAHHQLADLPGDLWERARVAATARGCTRNDLAVCAALRAADAILARRGRRGAPYCLMLPTNLRQTLGLEPGLQNFIGTLTPRFTVDEVASADLPRIVSERIREHRTPEEAVAAPVNLGILTALLPPWFMRRALRRLDADPESFFFSFLYSVMRAPPSLTRPEGTTRIFVRGSMGRRPGFGVVVTQVDERAFLVLEYAHPIVRHETARAFAEEMTRALEALTA